ncbi:nicotinate-nucleotide--dimethylbenzimidazole phosphoribosyltransferase [Saccharomonospora xinjiangensis]|uniref:nicotinate-nucleotide--dimethylbenzimidazole phosphoribosyltransferase n=1 Tax=Saccharomonospora xinjiangensis TaxID=75294 RepID=UPI00106FD0D5|nr:nicotinate-nucleotide--dimethylbenzimidazole phosphoribosyltransferase [Saccharomonospora xinjiangensis]QBQ59523.1 Nicotinate-nucleotide--dimethylbenzimidazole phosphoribosyltransferase [Saccharomonospora xinjiangensis]
MPIEFAEVPHPGSTQRRTSLPRFGTLDALGDWLAARQDRSRPAPPGRPRIVVFAADHGVSARGVSARPPEYTTTAVRELREGGTTLGMLAARSGAGVRVVDIAVDSEEHNEFKIRRGSGSIDTEDALTSEQAEKAVDVGRRIADAEVDEGADLLVPAELGVGSSTPAATLVAALTGTEPVAVVGRGSGIDDNTWMRKAAAVRDALRRARPVVTEPLELVRTAGGADLAALAGFLVQAAVRRTPVLLDGLSVCAAALLAEEFAPGARAWWTAAHRSTEPAHALALEHLDLEPLVDLGVAEGSGTGAAAVLPLVSMAAELRGSHDTA